MVAVRVPAAVYDRPGESTAIYTVQVKRVPAWTSCRRVRTPRTGLPHGRQEATVSAATDVSFIEMRVANVVGFRPPAEEGHCYVVLDEMSGTRHLAAPGTIRRADT